MLKQGKWRLLCIILLGFIFAMGTQQCAVIIPPTGGLRDTLAPVLLKSNPKDSATLVNYRVFNLVFNEYVELNNPNDEILISPLPTKLPEITSRLNVVTIRFRDSLQDNTTYNIKTGKAIKDYNEGNIAPNINLSFSSGSIINNYELNGVVYNSETGETDSTMMVLLYANLDDSAVVKQKPKYVAKCNNKGEFNFTYLAPNKYKLYALETKPGYYVWNDKGSRFAFYDEVIDITNANQAIQLRAYKEEEEKKEKSSSKIKRGGLKTKDDKEEDKRLTLKTNLVGDRQDLLGNLELTFNKPIKNFNASTAKLQIKNGATVPFTASIDSTAKTVTFANDWKENESYQLFLTENIATDSNNVNYYKKLDTINFITNRNSEYGGLLIKWQNVPKGNWVFQLYQGDKIVVTEKLGETRFFRKIFVPGEYTIRLVNDIDNNGKYTTGAYFAGKRQPEKVITISQKITVRANSDKEYNINIPATN
jgi:hypothetical protein